MALGLKVSVGINLWVVTCLPLIQAEDENSSFRGLLDTQAAPLQQASTKGPWKYQDWSWACTDLRDFLPHLGDTLCWNTSHWESPILGVPGKVRDPVQPTYCKGKCVQQRPPICKDGTLINEDSSGRHWTLSQHRYNSSINCRRIWPPPHACSGSLEPPRTKKEADSALSCIPSFSFTFSSIFNIFY